ncbi:MAG: amidase family protein [Oscillospiraceae bacterium]|nr:amidase family protein [Oscillospiraceae bacterium]
MDFDMECFSTGYEGVEPGDGSVALEDSIMHKGRSATAGSRMLEGFISPISATVIARLESAGYRILGKTTMDEFGASGLFPGAGDSPTSGSVVAVEQGLAEFALCNDYSGSVRRSAASHGLFYIHPTYGTVSRYGLIHCVPSMDQIGIVCRAPDGGERVLSIISGNDPNDGAMLPDTGFAAGEGSRGRKPAVVAVARNAMAASADSPAVWDFAERFEAVEFELEHFSLIGAVMQALCCAEISSSLCRYDGVKFGHRAADYKDMRELYTKTRTEAFGVEAKLAALAGAMVLAQENYSKYYDKSMRLRRVIKESLDFEKYDLIALPICSASPEGLLALHSLPQLCGLPSITAPFGNGGVTLIADAGREDVLFAALREALKL